MVNLKDINVTLEQGPMFVEMSRRVLKSRSPALCHSRSFVSRHS